MKEACSCLLFSDGFKYAGNVPGGDIYKTVGHTPLPRLYYPPSNQNQLLFLALFSPRAF